MNKSFDDFLEALGMRESGGKYNIENSIGFIGKYQWGEAMLYDLGYYLEKFKKPDYYDNKWLGEWTGKNNIWSKNDFLNNPAVQEMAIREEMDYLNKIMERLDFDKYIGKEINNVKITRTGILAGAHLKGFGDGGIKDFLKNGINSTDGYGTKISEYIKKFAGYKNPYDKMVRRYIWHSEEGENTCSACAEKDGLIFVYGEGPEPPLHPNCNCWIEDYDEFPKPDGYDDEYETAKREEAIQELNDKILEIEKQIYELLPVYHQTQNEEILDYINGLENIISKIEDDIEFIEEVSGNSKHSDIELEIKSIKSKNENIKKEIKYSKDFNLYIKYGKLF